MLLLSQIQLHTAELLAEQGLLLLGDDFLPWIVLAFGAAMVAGNVFALIRPPSSDQESTDQESTDQESTDQESTGLARSGGTRNRAVVGRAVVMILIGAVASVWGLASLLT